MLYILQYLSLLLVYIIIFIYDIYYFYFTVNYLIKYMNIYYYNILKDAKKSD